MSSNSNYNAYLHRKAGAAQVDVTPDTPQFLFGYPHCERTSTSVHDPLLASAIYLSDGQSGTLFVAVDVIFLTKEQVAEARGEISQQTGMPAEHIMITATHTHSGPITMSMLSNSEDRVVPKPDPTYLRKLINGIVDAGTQAFKYAQPAEVGLVVSEVHGLGTNRHNPAGPSIPELPVLVARSTQDQSLIGLMCICSMHPTVLHEDSTCISGDFPSLARQYLQSQEGLNDLVVVYHMGAAGNQSPRHVTRSNTLEEATRLGTILGKAFKSALENVEYVSDWNLACKVEYADLRLREFPSIPEATVALEEASAFLEHLRTSNAEKTEIRTAECSWFGAQETLTLARSHLDGRLEDAVRTCLPAEIQIVTIDSWSFVGWPGEVFVEYALELRQRYPEAHLITLANGELQGYLVTPEAVESKCYEASNAVFASPDSPRRLLDITTEMLHTLSTANAGPDA
ncbi:neutral/alkaline non-lysosomal ceramidase N-terminal domain-containing protein [Adhaeretor mobilis]|nr:neutral/alkaline non-lysosomal ceramidase N-terminal domain-containing protein [Adhaeretor mobilis]